MNFVDTLTKGFAYKNTVDEVVRFINDNPKQLSGFVKLLNHENKKVASRASWIIGDIFYKNPSSTVKVETTLVHHLLTNDDEMVLRNMVRIFQVATLGEENQSAVYDRCLQLINDEKRGVAIRAFAITVAANIAMPYPELTAELGAIIQPTLANATSGYLNRAKKELKRMQN